MNASEKCNNCNQIVDGNYCVNCGQKTSVDKITFQETFQDFIDSIASVNAPLFKTLKLLFVNPGKLFREFLGGKRKSYYKPVPFFILATLVYLIIRQLIDFDPFGNTTISIKDSTQSQLFTEARNFFLYHIDKLLFVFIFTLGIFLKLFFFKKYLLAEFIAIAFYLIGVYTLIVIINMFYIHYVNEEIQFMAIFVMCIYFVYAMSSFFKKKKFLVVLKSLIIYFLAFYSYAMLAFGVSYIIIWFKQN
jgi:hypothetical protein